ncbi:MAG TPA: AAA family ATPase, partial [Kineosporiaceae bacterium]|nr:AAA family ATPase [Kineosporiaceae bacterium]
MATLAQTRSTWRINHVRAEAQRAARVAGIRLENLDLAVDAVVSAALSDKHSTPLDIPDPTRNADPQVLRRADGTSVYEVAGTRRYSSEPVMAGERFILATAGRRDAWVIAPEAVEAAIAESAAAGRPLNPGQEQLVRQLAGTPAPLALGLAPAGTGKTTAMRVLARAAALGGRNVLGLAPSAAAAAVLRTELGTTTDTLAKLLHATTAHAQTGCALPDWVAAIGKDTMVVLDEAGMASTLDLAALSEIVQARGGRVVLIGDDQQLAAIGAGGVLRDIAETHGALTLSQVMRFTDPSEGAASLALRDGDPAAIAYYSDHDRIAVGDLAVCTEQAYAAWAGDLAAGRDAIMLAPTLDLVAELNARARADRLAQAPGPAGPVVDLVDGCQAGVGDTVITRENNRRIAFSASDWVKNGDRWQVLEVRPDGGLRVAHLGTGHRVYLPAAYVAAHVGLGYATTVHAAQGVTADIAHVVAAGSETRQLLYVALTRGRLGNYLYLTVAGDGDPHTVITRDALLPPTAVDVLARILARDGSATSATTTLRQNADPLRRLGQAAAEYAHALGVAAEGVLGAEGLAALERHAETVLPGLTHAAAWTTLRANLALQAAAGHDPAEVLDTAIAQRELDTALDPAAVLDWRLDPSHLRTHRHGPLPWLPGVPDVLAADPQWATGLPRRSRQVADLAAQVAAAAGEWTPTTAPAWARPLLDTDRQLSADLAVWRSAMGVPDTDPRPTGPPQLAAARVRHQQRLQARLAAVLGDPRAAGNRWRRLAEAIDPRITADPTWPTLAERLSTAARAGIDIAALATTVGTGRPLPDEQPAAALWWRLARHLR